MATIISNAVSLSETWGTTFCDYTILDKTGQPQKVDFQDLMIAISEKRAVSVEGEVNPLTTRIRNRNKDLEILGKALSELTAASATLKSDATGDTQCTYDFSDDVHTRVKRLTGYTLDDNEKKKWLEYFTQRVKSKIDGLNNEAQTDMSRLQSLVDRRDESYSTATNLMSAVSETRANLIRNL
ncbi:MAG: hypothetical protein IKO01_00375 [Kiritimatiellae bacterium]|nr:hypothetical protein [Kiritimatiellia bacterium]